MSDLAVPRIWIVDDSPLDAERARRALGTGFAAETFQDGSAALERLSTGRQPDVLVVDWVMPGISGIELCRFIRASPDLPQVAILLLTAQQATEQVVEGLAAGANDYVSKPYADAELVARVQALVRGKRLQEQLLEAQQEVREMLESSPDALLSVAPDGRILWANPEAERMLEQPAVVLRTRRLGQLIPALDRCEGTPRGAVLADVTLGDRIYSPTVRNRTIGRPMTVSMRDVSERRRADTRRLDFYSVVAHDLRTPLQALLLRVDVILRGRRGMLPADLVGELRKVDSGLRGLVTLINDFLDLARLDAAGAVLERQEVELSAILGEIIDEFQPLAEANEQSVELVGMSGPTLVVGDKRRLGQVFSNLIGNALKFTPSKGRITVSLSPSHEFIEATVTDNGPGIAREALVGLFDRFTRAGEGERILGSGLGLMIAREIVQAHGGDIGVRSDVGRGSTFWFRLPRANANRAALPGPGGLAEA